MEIKKRTPIDLGQQGSTSSTPQPCQIRPQQKPWTAHAARAASREPADTHPRSTVRLLAASASTRTTELLRLAPARVSDKQATVVCRQDLLDLALRRLIDEFLVVGYDGLGNRLADGIDLRGVATTLHADANVHASEALAAQQEDRLVDFELQHLRLHQLNRHTVNLHQPAALLAVGNSDGRLLAAKGLDRLNLASLVSHGPHSGGA
mmetsp:Transcript_1274/g.3281  ORF Transcript_1274/g.3281 Transcript_1274/m.3281 type:complete len:207 (+) Transcript_1274:196-816(+)